MCAMRTSIKTASKAADDSVNHDTDERAERGERDYVMALEKGLAIIEAFGQLRGSASLTQLK